MAEQITGSSFLVKARSSFGSWHGSPAFSVNPASAELAPTSLTHHRNIDISDYSGYSTDSSGALPENNFTLVEALEFEEWHHDFPRALG
jgi:hypothetical protein